MVFKIVLLQIVMNLTVVPVDNRQHLEHAALHAEHRQIRTTAGLIAPQPGEPGLRAQRLQRAVHRLNLVHLVILFNAFHALLPQLAVARFLPGCRGFGAEHLQIQAQLIRQLIDKTVGFRKEIAGIGKDNRNIGHLPRDQMQRHRRLNAETRREHKGARQVFQRPADARLRRAFFQLRINGRQRQRALDFVHFTQCCEVELTHTASESQKSRAGSTTGLTMPARIAKSPKPSAP